MKESYSIEYLLSLRSWEPIRRTNTTIYTLLVLQLQLIYSATLSSATQLAYLVQLSMSLKFGGTWET